MDILYIPQIDDGYHQLVVAREFLSRWTEARPLKQGISEIVQDIINDKVISRFRTPELVDGDRGEVIVKWTDLFLKCHHIWNITLNQYHGAANGVIEAG